MNEMYSMGILTHNMGVIGLLGVISINIIMLYLARDIRVYAKKMRIFMPIGAGLIATILFTGAVMMAAKHLNFTLENIIMILYGIALIGLEVRRYAKLKHLNLEIKNPFETYKKLAFTLLAIEFVGSLLISLWMWL
ncbi:MAG: hypothetical protein RBR59_01575 [Sulfurimonadaceae bacterium]|jgi:hypothetical protein|nr:hypothetical protein [Sulfurimonadaceae bacterium]